eukprot:TRINITY_DN25356_c0_g1_i1.p1 TRINITY_DN25356_c0_g1~~TRINITY_DN25356_c0_g1_i1.p1  ORF type:complete len:537 (-),score=102.02 TRINITY_DN25356_c0_g1_i1:137-1726(-)
MAPKAPPKQHKVPKKLTPDTTITQELATPAELLVIQDPRGRRRHGTGDWIWLGIVAVGILAFLWFWPVWDMLIGSEEANYWTILGVQRGADRGVIKRAYRDMAKKWHPDHNPGCGEACRDQMRNLQEAYRTLIDDPDAAKAKANDSEDRGFHAQLLHFFLGHLFEMGFHFAEFVVCLIPAFPLAKWMAARAVLVVIAGVVLYLYLSSVGVPLSWLGILICGYRFRKMATWELPVRAVGQQLNALVYVIIPALIGYLLYWRYAVRGAFSYTFYLYATAGVIYLSAFIVRFPAINVFITLRERMVPFFTLRDCIWLVFQLSCIDMLSYVMKIPPPFRVASHILLGLHLIQRWFYVRVRPTQTPDGPVLVVNDIPAHAKLEPKPRPRPDPSMLSQPKEKLSKEEKRELQRTEAESGSGVPVVALLVVLAVVLTAVVVPYFLRSSIPPPESSAPPEDEGRTPPTLRKARAEARAAQERESGGAKAAGAGAKARKSAKAEKTGPSAKDKQQGKGTEGRTRSGRSKARSKEQPQQ